MSVMFDLGQAADSMMLAAWELGIGSVPATVYDHALARELLGYPADRHCEYLLSFGYPADPADLTRPPRARRPPTARRARPRGALVSRRPGRPPPGYCQRNFFDAIAKQTTSQPSRTAAHTPRGANAEPSTMTCRNASER